MPNAIKYNRKVDRTMTNEIETSLKNQIKHLKELIQREGLANVTGNVTYALAEAEEALLQGWINAYHNGGNVVALHKFLDY